MIEEYLKFYIDGDTWCVGVGLNLAEGIYGFGSSPRKAYHDFLISWNKNIRSEDDIYVYESI